MRRKATFRVPIFSAAALVAAGLIAIPATSAGAGTAIRVTSTADAASPAALPIAGYYQMVVDSANGHIFFSEGTGDDIVVTNLSGTEVATIPGQDDAEGMTLSPDGSTLYVALAGSDEVSAISTSTLQQTTTYPLGASGAPLDVVYQSGDLWVSYSATHDGIGDFDLSSSTPAFTLQPSMDTGWYDAPILAADPEDSGVIAAADPGEEPAPMATYNVSGASVAVLASNPDPGNAGCSAPAQLAISPGGGELVAACGSPYNEYRFATATLAVNGDYPATAYPGAVAITSTGAVAVGTVLTPSGLGPNLYLYDQDTSTPLNTVSLDETENWGIADRGLAWSADDSTLFAVLNNADTSDYELATLDDPQLATATLTLNAPPSVVPGAPVSLTGELTSSNEQAMSGDTVTITRTLSGSSASTTFTTTTASNGSYSLTDTPPSDGNYIYTASYAGTPNVISSASASAAVIVARDTSTMSLSVPATAYIGSAIPVSGTLAWNGASPPSGTTITVTRAEQGSTATQSFTATTGSGGAFSLTDTPSGLGTYTYTASYAGSTVATAASAQGTVTVTKVSAGLKLTGPSTVTVADDSVTLDGTLSLGAGSVPSGSTVSVVRTGGGTTKTFTAALSATGTFTLKDTLPKLGSYTYTASYAGTADIAAASAKASVSYTLIPTALTISTGGTSFAYEPTIHVSVHLGKTDTNRVVAIYAEPAGTSKETLLVKGKVNSAGNLTATYRSPVDVKFSAVFTGDSRYASVTVKASVTVLAGLSEAIGGYYKIESVKGVTTLLFHPSSIMTVYSSVSPNKREVCLDANFQEWVGGAWENVIASDTCLNGNTSPYSTRFSLTDAATNTQYRVQIQYSGDSSNGPRVTSWQYFEIES